jgi:hypothetical protein
MMAMAVAGLAQSAISAVGQYKAGKAAEANYKSQANMAEFQGRSQAIAYKQKGVEALDGLVRSNASINAAAGAGLVQVNLTGSAATIKTANQRFGVSNFNTAKRNAVMATEMAGMQANIYRAAGKSAAQAGLYSAIGTLGKGFMMFAGSGAMGGGGGGGTLNTSGLSSAGQAQYGVGAHPGSI